MGANREWIWLTTWTIWAFWDNTLYAVTEVAVIIFVFIWTFSCFFGDSSWTFDFLRNCIYNAEWVWLRGRLNFWLQVWRLLKIFVLFSRSCLLGVGNKCHLVKELRKHGCIIRSLVWSHRRFYMWLHVSQVNAISAKFINVYFVHIYELWKFWHVKLAASNGSCFVFLFWTNFYLPDVYFTLIVFTTSRSFVFVCSIINVDATQIKSLHAAGLPFLSSYS